MITIKEYLLDPNRLWQIVGIHDGWKPLSPRLGPANQIILPCIVDTDEPESSEIIRLVCAGDDLLVALEGLDGAPLGYVSGPGPGSYLFLDIPPEDTTPVRRVTHPSLLSQEQNE